jgi:hypothetical protein
MGTSLLNLVFDKWDGDTPISNCYDTGFVKPYHLDLLPIHLKSPNLIVNKCKLKDINKSENFFYVINYMCKLIKIVNENNFIISEEILSYVRDKNLKVVFLSEQEVNRCEKKTMETLVLQLKKRNVPESNFYYLNNNSKLLQYKEELGCELHVHTLKCLFEFMVRNMNLHKSTFNRERESFFLLQNRRLKTHRVFILAYLKKHNILKDTNWSLLNDFNDTVQPFFNTKDERFLPYVDNFNYFTKVKNKLLKHEENYEVVDTSVCVLGDLQTYHQSYINLIAETYFEYDEIHITEKSFRSFYYYQLPVFIASYQHVQHMRKTWEFDFFDDLIDHSYDLERDHEKRLLMVSNEIKRLHDNKEIVIDFIKNNENRLIHNHNLIKLYNKQSSTIKLFTSFIKNKKTII